MYNVVHREPSELMVYAPIFITFRECSRTHGVSSTKLIQRYSVQQFRQFVLCVMVYVWRVLWWCLVVHLVSVRPCQTHTYVQWQVKFCMLFALQDLGHHYNWERIKCWGVYRTAPHASHGNVHILYICRTGISTAHSLGFPPTSPLAWRSASSAPTGLSQSA